MRTKYEEAVRSKNFVALLDQTLVKNFLAIKDLHHQGITSLIQASRNMCERNVELITMNELIEVLKVLENNILEHIERFFQQQLLFANFNNPEFLQSRSPTDSDTPERLEHDEQSLVSVMKQEELLRKNAQEDVGRATQQQTASNSPVDNIPRNRRLS